MTYFTISAWELGDSDPEKESLDALAALGEDFKELVEERRAEADGSALAILVRSLQELEATVRTLAGTVDEHEQRIVQLERRRTRASVRTVREAQPP